MRLAWLMALVAGPVLAGTVSVVVDAGARRHPISPEIYGVNGGDDEQLQRMGVTVRRWGFGNLATGYNWKTGMTNHARDWYFEAIPGSERAVDPWSAATLARGARPLIQLTTTGWITKGDGTARYCGFSVAKYGPQRARAPDVPDCGDGSKPGTPEGQDDWVADPDPTDTSFAADHTWAAEWVAHLAPLGVHDFQYDNEPGIWNVIHHDVHPARTTYDEMRDVLYAYGPAVKAADPEARLFGPASFGWTEYLFLSWEQGNNPEWDARGDFVPWYVDQAKAWEDGHGERILDFLDVHYYPQVWSTGETIFSGDVSPAVSAARLRETRSLWDPEYTDPTWIRAPVALIPRLKVWAARYPGTRTAITEYSFGAIDEVSGALAEADVLGIFGREGLDYAGLWWTPSPGSVGEDAFKLFRNYDGAGARFGDTSVRAVSSDVDLVTAYASEIDPGRLAVVLVNKDAEDTSVALSLGGIEGGGRYRAFAFGSSSPRLAEAGEGTVHGTGLQLTVPAWTAELIEYTAPDGGGGPGGCGCSGAGGLSPLLVLALASLVRGRGR